MSIGCRFLARVRAFSVKSQSTWAWFRLPETAPLRVAGLAALVATAAAGQEAHPPWRCGGALHPSELEVSDVGVARARAIVEGTGRPDCEGPCVFNIAFVYGSNVLVTPEDPEPSCGWNFSFLPRVDSLKDLEALLRSSVDQANAIWRENGLDAQLRFAGMAHHPKLDGASQRDPVAQGVLYVRRIKERLGADLVYTVLPVEYFGDCDVGFAGKAEILVAPVGRRRPEDPYHVWRVDRPVGSVVWGYLAIDPELLVHELGHNFGLAHDPSTRAASDEFLFWRGGQGFAGVGVGTIMSYGPTDWREGDPGTVPRYSTSEATFRHGGKEYSLGKKGVHESLEVLRWNIPRLALPPEPEPEPDPEYAPCDPWRWGSRHAFDHGYEMSACVEYEEDGQTWERVAADYGLDSGESALLYFFERDNVEVLVKVLDACGVNGHRWVFVGPVTTLAFNLEIREVATGRTWSYRNPRGGKTAQPRSDTAAFPCDATAASWAAGPGSGAGSASLGPTGAGRYPVELRRRAADAGQGSDCEPGAPAVTLSGGYRVGMCYETYDGQVGEARDFGLDSSQSALLYFFDRDNVEVLIKVLDGCGVNGHRWVFVAPVTDLAFNLHVESPGGQRWTHANRLGETASSASDVTAFPCASDS